MGSFAAMLHLLSLGFQFLSVFTFSFLFSFFLFFFSFLKEKWIGIAWLKALGLRGIPLFLHFLFDKKRGLLAATIITASFGNIFQWPTCSFQTPSLYTAV